MFGDEFAIPVVGNFDPPVTPGSAVPSIIGNTNPDNPYDVNGDGVWNDSESYTDTNANGAYDVAEPYDDVNADGMWNDAESYTEPLRAAPPELEGDLLLGAHVHHQ